MPQDINGNEVKFSEKFAGKVSKEHQGFCAAQWAALRAPCSLLTQRATQVVLMTNVASACGYTRSNYQELVALHEKYNKQGLEIVAFPCNQVRRRNPLGRTPPGGALTLLRRSLCSLAARRTAPRQRSASSRLTRASSSW